MQLFGHPSALDEAPALVPNFPAGHSSCVDEELQYVPGAHIMHDFAPRDKATYLVEQFLHDVSIVCPLILLNVPFGHNICDLALGQYAPLSQLRQDLRLHTQLLYSAQLIPLTKFVLKLK